MNNLTTRKIVLGMLMGLVLAFGVQGIAEAVTIEVTSGNHQTKKPGETFSITLRITDLVSGDLTNADDDTDSDDYSLDVSFHSDFTLTTTSNIDGNNLEILNVNLASTYTRTLNYRVNDDAVAEERTANGATVYIVPDSDITATEPTLAVGAAGYRTAVGMIQINGGASDLLGTVEDHKPLRYSVSSGGTLYVPDGTTNGRDDQ